MPHDMMPPDMTTPDTNKTARDVKPDTSQTAQDVKPDTNKTAQDVKPDTNKTAQDVTLAELKVDSKDNNDRTVREVLFRGREYAIYRSDRGVEILFSDTGIIQIEQRSAYTKIIVQICELRYLTSQMRSEIKSRKRWPWTSKMSIYDHNMAQALMLLMESVEQRRCKQTEAAADATEKEAKDIVQGALDMAVRRNTVDNTIRYVGTCVGFGLTWLVFAGLVALGCHRMWGSADPTPFYLMASSTGIIGAVFSVIVRAQAFELKPCNDSSLNKLMSAIRVAMGGIAGPVLFLLLTTVAANALGTVDISKPGMDPSLFARMVAIVGLIGGFAERLVPNLVNDAASKMQGGAGTPGQAMKAGQKD
jgi:hypothetical protein